MRRRPRSSAHTFERTGDRTSQRNGSRPRTLWTTAGDLDLKIPKLQRDPISQHDRGDAHLTNAAWNIHQDDPEFGYRFISDELGQAGPTAGENRTWRLGAN